MSGAPIGSPFPSIVSPSRLVDLLVKISFQELRGISCSHVGKIGKPQLDSMEFPKACGTQWAPHLMIHWYPKCCDDFGTVPIGWCPLSPLYPSFHLYLYLFIYQQMIDTLGKIGAIWIPFPSIVSPSRLVDLLVKYLVKN